MDYNSLRSFATHMRSRLMAEVAQQLRVVLTPDSLARRESPHAVAQLTADITRAGAPAIIDAVAYTWFNRFVALRFMDLNRYLSPAIISPVDTDLQPQLLVYAKQGIFEQIPEATQSRVVALLTGRTPAPNPDEAAYRLLLIAACNHLHRTMDFLFEPVADYSELLLPNDLTSPQSLLTELRSALTPAHCHSVELLGWLYQYYIADRKDELMQANQAYAAADIPAVTQLFTPNWIVRYLVENSLGRLWLRSFPQSPLAQQMPYFVADDPSSPPPPTCTVSDPTQIRLLDPACGSGHMLSYAFDLLLLIYQEVGYSAAEAAPLILQYNLHGIDLCPRASQLAAMALVLKARAVSPAFLGRSFVQPQILCLRDIHISDSDIRTYQAALNLGQLFDQRLTAQLQQFQQASTLGSLIQPILHDGDIAFVRQQMDHAQLANDIFLQQTHAAISTVLTYAQFLDQRYHVVVANPPYMGNKGMNAQLKAFMAQQFPKYKSDLFAAFMARCTDLAVPNGYLGFMTPFVWMFISSYEELRHFITQQQTLLTLVQLEYSGFDGATVPICTFAFQKGNQPQYRGGYVRLSDFRGSENQGPKTLQAIADPHCGWFFRASASDFAKIPGSPIAYWVSESVYNSFSKTDPISEKLEFRKGMGTGANATFVRQWQEISHHLFAVGNDTHNSFYPVQKKWFPYNNGGNFRRWYGNNESVVNWENDGFAVKNKATELNNGGHWSRYIIGTSRFFQPGITWTAISSSYFATRIFGKGFLFSSAAMCGFGETHNTKYSLSLLNSKVAFEYLKILTPTLNFGPSQVEKIPYFEISKDIINEVADILCRISMHDWDDYETSWDFHRSPLLADDLTQPLLAERYAALVDQWQAQTDQMHQLEVENNRIFIEAYGLQDELTPDVPLTEITLTCNPYYRYGDKPADQLADLQRTDTMRELLSYAVGCMMGRYSLDKPGLILANAGDGIAQYLQAVGLAAEQLCFAPDDDGVIPIVGDDGFSDDIVVRTRAFVQAAFGPSHLEQNVTFIEQSLGRALRDYYSKDFYKYHLQHYKNRPIYWMVSSPNGTFKALIYLHRYRRDTMSIVLKYVRQYRHTIESAIVTGDQQLLNPQLPKQERTTITKQLDTRRKQLAELKLFEGSVYDLASQQIAIDLDDGVKVNYRKFKEVLIRIPSLEKNEE